MTRPPAENVIRSCACSFCRSHGTRTVSDPAGRGRHPGERLVAGGAVSLRFADRGLSAVPPVRGVYRRGMRNRGRAASRVEHVVPEGPRRLHTGSHTARLRCRNDRGADCRGARRTGCRRSCWRPTDLGVVWRPAVNQGGLTPPASRPVRIASLGQPPVRSVGARQAQPQHQQRVVGQGRGLAQPPVPAQPPDCSPPGPVEADRRAPGSRQAAAA